MIETLGQYKILEPAGSGALGDVYRARDTRVGRTVAITVVSDQIAANPERPEVARIFISHSTDSVPSAWRLSRL